MFAEATPFLSRVDRRRGMRLGIIQGTLWSVGNGLTTGTFISYFLLELGATSIDLSYILALPGLVGILRLAAPAVLRLLGGYRSASVALLIVSYLLVATVPAAAPASLLLMRSGIWLLASVLCVHQLLEYMALVSIWAWLGQIVPSRMRGRYFALRQRWMLAVQIPVTILAAVVVDLWRYGSVWVKVPRSEALWAYVAALELGTLFLIASIVPLVKMPSVPLQAPRQAAPRSSPVTARARESFMLLVLAGCWISFFTGLTVSPQSIYPYVVGINVWALCALRAVMQVGQMSLAPWVGKFSDRFGNRPTLIICQVVVATAPLFFLAASDRQPWWLAGAYIVWSAYVGLNVCLPNLMLKLSPHRDSSPYVALYFGLTGVAAAIGTMLGGWVLSYYRHLGTGFQVGLFLFDQYEYLFYIGFVMRMVAVLFLLAIPEEGAWTLRQIASFLQRRRRRASWDLKGERGAHGPNCGDRSGRQS